MTVKNLSILLITSILLSGCNWFGPKPINIKTEAVERIRLNIPEPTPVSLKPVKFFIITPENSKEVFQELKDKNYDLVLFGLTDEGYENLSLNMAEIRKYMIENRELLKAYKEYYEADKEKK